MRIAIFFLMFPIILGSVDGPTELPNLLPRHVDGPVGQRLRRPMYREQHEPQRGARTVPSQPHVDGYVAWPSTLGDADVPMPSAPRPLQGAIKGSFSHPQHEVEEICDEPEEQKKIPRLRRFGR